jgi:hypothetical protein
MAHLEVATRSQAATIPVIEGVEDLYLAFEEILVPGTNKPYGNVALLSVPERIEWELPPEEDAGPDLYTLGSLALSAKPKDLAFNMERVGNHRFRRVSELICSYYIAAPAKGSQRITLDLSHAVCFDGAELINALSDSDVPMEVIDLPLVEPPFGAYMEHELGSFLLDLAAL